MFPTPSGRLEFVSERMTQAGLDPVAGFTPAHHTTQLDSTRACEFPLLLLTPANHYFLNSTFANVPSQQQRAGAPRLLIHPIDAAPKDIATGDDVCVSNQRGAFTAVAEVTESVRPGVVASTKGRWPSLSKHRTTVNATVDEGDADMGAGALYHDNRVRISRTKDKGPR